MQRPTTKAQILGFLIHDCTYYEWKMDELEKMSVHQLRKELAEYEETLRETGQTPIDYNN